jgi:hypothetical protein
MLHPQTETSFPLLETKLSTRTTRSWLPWGYNVQLRYEVALSFPAALPLLADRLIALLPRTLWSTPAECDNYKGRDKARLLEHSPLCSLPYDQELLWCSGRVATEVSQGEIVQTEAFSCLVTTSFREFRGNSAIAFDPKIVITGPFAELDRNFVARQIATLPVVVLEEFRLGVERFSARHYSSLLGLSPSVDQMLTIEADHTRLVLEIVHQGLRRPTDLPFHGDALWRGLQRVLSDCCAISESR